MIVPRSFRDRSDDRRRRGTDLHYEADVQVGGVLATVGSRLVPTAARKMMDDFFRRLQERLTAEDGRE